MEGGNSYVERYLAWEKALAIRIYEIYKQKSKGRVLKVLTFLLVPGLWMLVAGIFLIAGIFFNNWYNAAVLWGVYLTALPVYELVKIIIKRPRPYDVHAEITPHGKREKNYSFPSGHASFGAVIVTMLWLNFYPVAWLFVFVLVYAVFAGFTRLALGVHYLSDVIVGIVYGFSTAIIYFVYIKEPWLWLMNTIF